MVGADRRELAGVLSRCRDAERLDVGLPFAVRARLRDQAVLLAANGPGPVLAGEVVRRLAGLGPLRAIVSTGSCGALDPGLEPGEIFAATEVCCPRTGVLWPARTPRAGMRYRVGRLVSMDCVVCSAAEKAALRSAGDAVEMEAAGVAREAQALGLPFYAVRAVLDGACESFRLDYNALRGPDGRFHARRLLGAMMRQPQAAAELIELRRRLRRVADVLGDFLAGCEF